MLKGKVVGSAATLALLFWSGSATAAPAAQTLSLTGASSAAAYMQVDEEGVGDLALVGVGVVIALLAAIYFLSEDDDDPVSA